MIPAWLAIPVALALNVPGDSHPLLGAARGPVTIFGAIFGTLCAAVAIGYAVNLAVVIKRPDLMQLHFDRQQARANGGFVR